MPTPNATATTVKPSDKESKPKTKTKMKPKKTCSGSKKRTQPSSASKRNGHAASPKSTTASAKARASSKSRSSPKSPSGPSPAAGPSNTSPEPLEKIPSSENMEGMSKGADGGVENGIDIEEQMADELRKALEQEEQERAIAEELARRIRRVQAGSLDNLPPLPSRIVRIFTSSTFTGG